MLRPIVLCLAAILGTAATAAPLETLVEEQARMQLGAELPEEASFAVTLQQPGPDDAIMLSAFRMDRASGQFLADAVTSDGKVQRIAGLAIPTVRIVVPVRRMLPDEIVADDDLQDIELPLARVGAFALTRREALVGMQVRRVLAQGRPVMTQSVMQPLLIDRGDHVSIHYDDGLLSLTAPGRALDDAHRGGDIRVVNLVSNAIVSGIAADAGIVVVSR